MNASLHWFHENLCGTEKKDKSSVLCELNESFCYNMLKLSKLSSIFYIDSFIANRGLVKSYFIIIFYPYQLYHHFYNHFVIHIPSLSFHLRIFFIHSDAVSYQIPRKNLFYKFYNQIYSNLLRIQSKEKKMKTK